MRIGETIYCDYQAATPIDPRVLDAMTSAYGTLFANPHSADHVLGWQAGAVITQSAEVIARHFGMDGDDLLFTSGASEANMMAVEAIAAYARSSGKSEIMVGAADHASLLDVAQSSELTVRLIPLNTAGAPDRDWLMSNLSDGVAGVSVIGVNNENGAITDLSHLADACEARGVLLHVDMAQVPLAMDIDVLERRFSFATLSSHKVYGPKGVGALLISPQDRKWLNPLIIGGGQQGGLRGGTIPTELCVGFSEAIRILSKDSASERLRVSKLRNLFVSEVENRQLGTLVGQRVDRHPGNALIHFEGIDANDLLARLQPAIAASSQSACSSGSIEPSRIVQAMGFDRQTATETVRFSFGRWTDETQICETIDALKTEISRIRN